MVVYLQLLYSLLARKVTTGYMLPDCLTKSLISVNENELIMSKRTETKQVENLILYLHTCYKSDPACFSWLFTIMRKYYKEGGSAWNT